jgi:hypothetical protein
VKQKHHTRAFNEVYKVNAKFAHLLRYECFNAYVLFREAQVLSCLGSTLRNKGVMAPNRWVQGTVPDRVSTGQLKKY